MEKGALSCTTRGAGQNPEPYMVQGRIKDLKIDKGRFMKSYLVLLVVLILIGFLSFDSAFPQAGIKESEVILKVGAKDSSSQGKRIYALGLTRVTGKPIKVRI